MRNPTMRTVIMTINFENWHYDIPEKIKQMLQHPIYGNPEGVMTECLQVLCDIISSEEYMSAQHAVASADSSFVTHLDAIVQGMESDADVEPDVLTDIQDNFWELAHAMGAIVLDLYDQVADAIRKYDIRPSTYVECNNVERLDEYGSSNLIGFSNRITMVYDKDTVE